MRQRQRKNTTSTDKLQNAKLVGRALRECLRRGDAVELEGLGVFVPGSGAPGHFVAATAPRVFIAYVAEDRPAASRLYADLAAAGLSPWLDRRKLLPGQAWNRCIEHAIETSDFFIACFSATSSAKRGHFPYEVRYALRCAERMPLDDMFVLPVRLDDCTVPRMITAQTQCLDMFPDWNAGVSQLITSMRAEMLAREGRVAA
jgi:hypothetical protein